MSENNRPKKVTVKPKKAQGDVFPYKCDVRLSDSENSMLEHIADNDDITKSEVMRKALRHLFNLYKMKE